MCKHTQAYTHAHTHTPVSYTHLDVYKRQVYRRNNSIYKNDNDMNQSDDIREECRRGNRNIVGEVVNVF